MPIYKMEGKQNGLQKYRVRVNYTDKEGKPKQLDRVAYGKEAAKELERQLNFDLKEETATKMTLQQLYDEYVKVQQYEIRESTLNNTKNNCRDHILPELKDYRIDRLTAKVLQNWKLSMEKKTNRKGEKFSLSTKQHIYKIFSALLNYAVKMEYLPRNPLTLVGNFKDAYEGKHEMDYYTPEEFLKFISAGKAHASADEKATGSINEWNYYVFFYIAFYTGMRKGEIHALKWSDIYDNTIHVTRSLAQRLNGRDCETPPKNKSSIRDIQIPAPLQRELTAHYNRCQNIAGFTSDWRVCGGPVPSRDVTISRRGEAYAKAANVKKIRTHDFRHSHASYLANNGINIQEIARRLGHSNIEITWNTYSHLYPREEERAIKVLNAIEE